MSKNIRIDSFIESFVKRLSGEGYALPIAITIADEKTIELSNELREVIKCSGLSYEQAKKALILADEGLYREIINKANPL